MIGALAMLDRAIDGLEDQNPSLLGRTCDVLVYPDDLRAVRDDVAELVNELDMASQIIVRALSCLVGDARAEFLRTLKEDGLDGEGLTRHHERKNLLARVGAAA